jgi:subtilisin family serine protease
MSERVIKYMKRIKTKLLFIQLFFTLLIFSVFSGIPTASLNDFHKKETALKGESFKIENQAFKPIMWKPPWADQDNNGIVDTLDKEIIERLLNKTAGEYAKVVVALKSEPTTNDVNAFTLSGGYVTTSLWTHAIYGFGGQIPYNRIADFVQSNPNVLFVNEAQMGSIHLAYAAQQVGARPYVWNTSGLQGDPEASIAIIDTGIDDTHPDFSPGFGDEDFTKKIVGWDNEITKKPPKTPYDDNGHGSHVAGLAAGNGFFSVDDSGNAIATWGANLGEIGDSGIYIITGMMVNKTGTITIKVKWANAGTGRLYQIKLYYGDKTLNISQWEEVKSVTTPDQNTWYTLTYNVTSTPSGGYDMYHVAMRLLEGTGDLYTVFTMSWPFEPPEDGYPAWTGIAPQSKLVGIKVLDESGSGWSDDLLNGIDWIIANRETYHIVVTSMSLGFGAEVPEVDLAVENLVNSGITTVVSAGNSGPGTNFIYTPGSVDEVITVAAINQFDNIVHYSSQGGVSRYKGNVTKPDIAAPGGSFFAVPLFSAESNDWDAEKKWSDIAINDSAPMQGTSMSAPIVAGAASIVIEAMGGFANWGYNRSQALLPKMILLMTATETYPNPRERYSWGSPTLERGGKDVHEGYGRLNLDAAVDALLKTYEIGSTVQATLGKPPTLTDISVLGDRLAWARNVQLITKGMYNFTLTVPEGSDFDLYLYNSTGTSYGEPAIVAKSTNATTGGHEQIILEAPYNGTYYLVVKRATATTQNGTFTLESSYMPEHDIAVVKVEPSATSVYQGNTLNITVTVRNKGSNPESFNVTTFYNNSTIETQTITNLTAGAKTTITLTWDTSEITPNNYTIKAKADIVENEYNTTNNLFIDGTVYVKIPGDENGDGIVNGTDLEDLSVIYGSVLGAPNWNPDADFNADNIISVQDLLILGKNYGKTV